MVSTALVTGAAGFVGRHMVRDLRDRGWNVTGVDRRPIHSDLSIHGDVRRIFSGRSEAVSSQVFDLVVHCAYHVGGRAAINGDASLLALNLELDAQLFDWAVRTGQRAVMYFSSSAVYPICYQQGGSEGPLSEYMVGKSGCREPDARYGWAKLTGERLASAAADQGLRVHVLRPFSGYGGDQDRSYPFPAILSRVLGGDLSVWGPPGQTRDWIHISDVIRGAYAVYQADCREPVNLCTGVGTEFGVLATMMARAAGFDVGLMDPTGRSERVSYLEDRPTGVLCRVGDPRRMLDLYHPEVCLDEGIQRALTGVDR